MLVESLLINAAEIPDQVALIDDTGTRTYKELAGAAVAMAMVISSQAKQQNVGLVLPAGAGFVASFYGTLLAGKSVVPINFLLSEREVAHVLQDSGVDLVITIPQLAGKIKTDRVKILDLTHLAQQAAPAPEPTAAFLAGAKAKLAVRDHDDLAVLMYTSGTSGLPKGVILTFNNLQSDVNACIKHERLNPGHVFLGFIPLFHAFGMTALMIAPIQLRARIIYLARFSAIAALNAIREHKVSLAFGVPSMLNAIAHLKSAVPDDFKSIFALISGGEPLPGNIRRIFKERFNLTLYEGYGLTETCAVAALNTPWAAREGSVGKPIPCCEVRIAAEDGSPLPIDHDGEVWLRGPMIMRGYFNLPKETAESLTPDGFFKTGDLGKLDVDGFLHITGRKKDLIIVAGEKASPREIEEILIQHPSVAEAAVVGKKDTGRGEIVVAFVIAREGQEISPDSLRDFCREHGLAQWKIPREITIEKDFPRTPTGKILKRVLAEQANQPR